MTTQTQTQDVRERRAAPAEEAVLVPAVHVLEDRQGIRLRADLPGVSRDKLALQIDGDSLIIEGEISLDLPAGLQASHTEVGLSRFRRVFTLSKELDGEKISADFEQGVLTLRIPKAEHAQPRRIDIQVQ